MQSKNFIDNHSGNIRNLSIYGQESNPTTWKMAKMNLAIRGLEANLGEHQEDTFLNDLHKTYGYYLAYVKSVELTGADAMEKAAKMMADLRSDAPKTIGDAAVTAIRDYSVSIEKDLVKGTESAINLPKSNVLEFILGEKGSVIVRPSGTEPKVKFYYTAVGATAVEAKELLKACAAQMAQ